MKGIGARIFFCATLMVVAGAGAMVLVSRPAVANPGGFQSCPVPPCLAPCVLGAEPEVLCKFEDGGTDRTTFACCCCGGGGNSFKPLK